MDGIRDVHESRLHVTITRLDNKTHRTRSSEPNVPDSRKGVLIVWYTVTGMPVPQRTKIQEEKRMRNFLSMACAALLAAAFVAGAVSNAQATGSPVPGLSAEAFQEALAADRLMAELSSEVLVRVPLQDFMAQIQRYDQAVAYLGGADVLADSLPDDLPETIEVTAADLHDAQSYLSLSPDGTRMLIIADGLPMVADLTDRTLRFILPDAAMNRDYFARCYRRFPKMPEDQHVTWSSDGRYVALAWPERFFLNGNFTANILLLDLEKGVSRAVDQELEQKAKLKWHEFETGCFPVKAAFSRDSACLYIEAWGVIEAGGVKETVGLLRSYDLQTRKMTDLARWDASATYILGVIADTGQGILRAVMQERLPPAISCQTPSGERLIQGEKRYRSLPDQQMLAVLHMVRGEQALLALRINPQNNSRDYLFNLFRVDEVDASVFDHALAIRKDAGPADRLVLVDLAAGDYAFDGLLKVTNATLSMDGNYLLMSASDQENQRDLYLCDLARGITGRVSVPESTPRGYAYHLMNGVLGLKWSGRHVLMSDGHHYCLHEFGVLSQ